MRTKEEIKIYQALYRKQNRKKLLEYFRHRWQEKKDLLRQKAKEYKQTHREQCRLRGRKNYLENKQAYIDRAKLRAFLHHNELVESRKKYYELNKTKLIRQSLVYTKERRKRDINFRIKCNLRTRIWWALRKNTKSDRTINLIGCSIEYLKHHLESQFKEGMNWENYGKWHIDHIRPCASFDLSKVEEQKKCFHYTNLQPLWKEDNIKKSDKQIRGDFKK